MSNYYALTVDPKTKKTALALWLDNYYGSHQYGVKFRDGRIYPEDSVKIVAVCDPAKHGGAF